MANNNSNYPPEVISVREGPELGRASRPAVIAKPLPTDYPLIDCDPHISRVLRFARTSDWAWGGAMAATGPVAMLWMERVSPTNVGAKHFASIMRLTGVVSLTAGFLLAYSKSINRFYGFSENRREIDLDMREMVDRVKRGEPLYGRSTLTEYMQGAASRQSRYAAVWIHAVPWFNFVNHPHHGVDTAKYYRQAEKELEAEGADRVAS